MASSQSPGNICVHLIILREKGVSDVPFSGEAPSYRWWLCESTLLRHSSACDYFSLDVQLPLNSLIITTALCTHVHCPNCGWETHLAPALWKRYNLVLKTTENKHGLFYWLYQTHILPFKEHQNHIEYFYSNVESTRLILQDWENKLLSQLFPHAGKADLTHCTRCSFPPDWLKSNLDRN